MIAHPSSALALALLVLSTSACAPEHEAPAPVAPAESSAPAAAAPARASGAPLVFTPPADWTVETPTSSMRKAQYRLPRAAGDAEDAECVVFFFGEMGGGGIEENVARWCSQFQQPDGRASLDVAERSKRTVAGMAVYELALTGTYVAETAPGSGVRVNKPGFALRAAILESDHGLYYVKLTGPAATVQQHAPAFADLVTRVR